MSRTRAQRRAAAAAAGKGTEITAPVAAAAAPSIDGWADLLRARQADVRAAEAALGEAARQAHAAGVSWTVVGAALGVSRQAARQRWSPTA